MDELQNTTQVSDAERSNLADWIGVPLQKDDSIVETIRQGDDKVVPDHLDWAGRIFELLPEITATSPLSYGPGSAPTTMYSLFELFKSARVFKDAFSYYKGFSYDSVRFRITSSSPKGIAGGYYVGVFPWQTWGERSFNNTSADFGLNAMTLQRLVNSPDSQLKCFGEAMDTEFVVPWQYNTTHITTNQVNNFSRTTISDMNPIGTPVLWFANAGMRYVTSVSMPAQIRIFVTFEGLRFLAPIHAVAQSGLEPAAQMAAAFAVDAAVAAGAEILDSIFGAEPSHFSKDNRAEGSFEAPSSVQLAYVGDSTYVGPPPTTPIFRDWFEPTKKKHKFLDFLRRPQLVGGFETGSSTHTYYANPISPDGLLFTDNKHCSYFSFFAQFASYWRGTIIFDFVIMGHPMVEVMYEFGIDYMDQVTTESTFMSQNTILKGLGSGVLRIAVPMPFMRIADHLVISDGNGWPESISSKVLATVQVVSTLLDITPIIPIAVFMRAGEDFEFLQPFPVGLYNVDTNESLSKRKTKKNKLAGEQKNTGKTAQINLPEVNETFETRAKVQKTTNTLVPLVHLEDLTSIWSRALPYRAYDNNDEPIVTLQPGTNPFWFPLEGGAAAWTLDANNSWWVTNDYLSMLSTLFLFYRGSIGIKICCLPGVGYKYISLANQLEYRKKGHNPFTFTEDQLPPLSNFGAGTAATDLGGQPIIDLTVPLRGPYAWGFCNPLAAPASGARYLPADDDKSVITNVVLHIPEGDLQDTMHRKTGDDWQWAIETLLPPPTLWASKGGDWT